MEPGTQQEVLVGPILIGDIRPLFPLMQVQDTSLTWPRWRAYARRLLRSGVQARQGIMVARRAGHPMPCGAVCYRLDHDLHVGRIMTAEHFVALDLLYPGVVRTALARALEGRASELGCSVIRALVHESDAEVAEDLRHAGHRPDGFMLVKERGRQGE